MNNLHGHSPVIQLQIEEQGSFLQSYPWELLHDHADFLFREQHALPVRHVNFEKPITPLQTQAQLQVLVLSPRPPMHQYGLDNLGANDLHILTALAHQHADALQVQSLDPTEQSTLEQMAVKLTRQTTHIIHIDTHGEYGWRCRNGHLNLPGHQQCQQCQLPRTREQTSMGYLAFADQKQQLQWVSGDELGRQLIKRNIQMVVLSACNSGQVAGASTFTSVAGALIRRGIPAVVAMQFPIDLNAAQVFAQAFYTCLLNGLPLVDAISEGRTSLQANIHDDSWYRPVVYLRTDKYNYRGQLFLPARTYATSTTPLPDVDQSQLSPQSVTGNNFGRATVTFGDNSPIQQAPHPSAHAAARTPTPHTIHLFYTQATSQTELTASDYMQHLTAIFNQQPALHAISHPAGTLQQLTDTLHKQRPAILLLVGDGTAAGLRFGRAAASMRIAWEQVSGSLLQSGVSFNCVILGAGNSIGAAQPIKQIAAHVAAIYGDIEREALMTFLRAFGQAYAEGHPLREALERGNQQTQYLPPQSQRPNILLL